MKYLGLLLFVSFALFTLCKASVVQVTDENFSDLVEKNDEWLLDFYADWCGYCKRLEPKFYAADRLLAKSTHSHVKLGKVNVETNPGLAARFFVSRLPSIVHIKDHEVRQLKPTQKENDIISFVTMEEWREVDPQSGLISPFSLFGKMIGLTGKIVKQMSSYSPWALIGVLTGFLIFAISLPILLKSKVASDRAVQNPKEIDNPSEQSKTTPKLQKRKSKRID